MGSADSGFTSKPPSNQTISSVCSQVVQLQQICFSSAASHNSSYIRHHHWTRVNYSEASGSRASSVATASDNASEDPFAFFPFVWVRIMPSCNARPQLERKLRTWTARILCDVQC